MATLVSSWATKSLTDSTIKGGNLTVMAIFTDWWTKEDADKFTEKAQCIVDEYSQFSVGDTKINGKLTLGENTADNGGMRLAYRAFLARAADAGARSG